jgi:hypothetical protein
VAIRYINAQKDLANEVSVYYRREAIALFMTEQFANSERFPHKHDDLINRALHADYCVLNRVPYYEPQKDNQKV